jgi:hypothetical protein
MNEGFVIIIATVAKWYCHMFNQNFLMGSSCRLYKNVNDAFACRCKQITI